jgi:dihydroorotase
MNLLFNETAVLDFDSNFKVMPPLRRESDRIALWNGLNDGTIDTVVSDHRPHDKEEKDVEFDNASFGVINLQTEFASLMNCAEADLYSIVKALSTNSRDIADIPHFPIQKGNKADLTVFSPNTNWVFERKQIVSSVTNSPFIGKSLKGTVIAVINNDQLMTREL